jgi:ribonucleotide reductase beta subunit family protein with ferritin-like domain
MSQKLFDVNANEWLFKNTERVSAFPPDPRFSKILENYNTQQSSFWVLQKVRIDDDERRAFSLAPKDIQETTKKVLGYFAGSDEIVEEIIQSSCLSKIKIPEIQRIYAFESTMEYVHSDVYNMTLSAYVPDTDEFNRIKNAIKTMPSVAKKAEWAQQWIADKPLDQVLIGKACVEGINFSSSFGWIDWLKTQNYKFKGLYEGNDEISRDEARHVDTSCYIREHVVDKITPDNAKEIIDGSLEVEIQFVKDAIPDAGYVGMNQELMIDYVRHCAGLLSADLGFPDFYKNTYCPFGFAKLRSLNSKVNFFEKRETNYTVYGSSEEVGTFDDAIAKNAVW